MSGSRSALREICLRGFLWLLLSGWIGSWAGFALLTAPTAFRVLPSMELAGRLVGPVVSALHVYGIAAGVLLALLTWSLGRGRALVALSLAAAALCAYSELRITPQIAAIRPLVFGPEGSPELAARFQLLHRISVTVFFSVGLSTLVLLAAHVRADVLRNRA
jgi:hypothetical protein